MQGPTPAGAESSQSAPPPAATATASASAHQDGAGSPDNDGYGIENGLHGAAAATATTPMGVGDDSISRAPPSGAGFAESAIGGPANGGSRNNGSSAAGTGGQGGTGWSFARVTAMNGHFPTLNPSGAKAGGAVNTVQNSSNQAAGAWGTTTAENTAVYGGGSGGGARGWGPTANDPSKGTAIDSVGQGRTPAERVGGITQASGRDSSGTPNSTGKKKGRKGKAVSLFSNSGVRGGAR